MSFTRLSFVSNWSWKTSRAYDQSLKPFIRCLVIFLLLLPSLDTAEVGLDLNKCDTVLGMQNGDIEDAAISASSSLDAKKRGPSSSRIRTEKGDGAWCPKQQISSDTYQYLEVDLRQLKVVTMVETQGRFGNGQGTEHTDQYRLEYQREDDGDWFRFKNRRGQEVFQGNSNTYIAEMREVQPMIIARRIRFVPVSSHPKNVCLRVELYGCPWKDGVVSYEMPQGHRYDFDLDLVDLSYDGTLGEVLHGGLGQLMDGEEGQTNFRLDSSDQGGKNYRWIAWKNESLSSRPLSIVFTFDAVRNFSFVYVRCNNMFSKGVRVFQVALIYFGIERKEFGTVPAIKYLYARDNQAEYARTIKIPLENNIGRFVKIHLFFDGRWIMISEVHFESEIAALDPGRGHGASGIRDHVTSSLDHMTFNSGLPQASRDEDFSKKLTEDRRNSSPLTSPRGNDVIYMNDGTMRNLIPPATSAVVWFSSSTPDLWRQPAFRNGLDYGSVVVMIIVLTVLLLVLCSVILLIFYRHHRLACISGPCGCSKKSSAILTNPPSTCSISRPSSLLYPSSYLIHSASYRPSFQVPSYSNHDDPCHSTASDFLISPNLVSPYATIELPLDRAPEVQSDESSSMDGVYTTPASLQLLPTPSNMAVVNIPRSSLKFLHTLGEGRFGQVYVCEVMESSASFKQLDSDLGLADLPPFIGSTVAVKVLQHNASELKRSIFEREVRKLLRLKDPNIASMLTFFMDEEPFCIVLEYTPFGDLKFFLRERAPEQFNRDGTLPGCDLPSYGCLIFMASQIASGMRYFEMNGLVHRDLAARNCLVGEDFVVKVSDLGTSQHQYPLEYSTCVGQVLLPIRWMAWESILMGSFTTKSDIWAFGVTFWEILTLAEALPYRELTDGEVIENCHNIYCEKSTSKDTLRLDRPPRCPREIYDLLCHCWAKDDSRRPTFQEIQMFLQKKNAGYSRENERQSTAWRAKNAAAAAPRP